MNRMRIGIVAPFNPVSVQNYFKEPLIEANQMASSVNNLVVSFLEAGNSVCVFTLVNTTQTVKYVGKGITLYVIGTNAKNIFNRSFPSLRKQAVKLVPYIREELDNLDVIHAQWCYEYALAAREFEMVKPVYCTIRDIAPVIFKNMTVDGKLFRLINKLYWAYRIIVFNKVISDTNISFVANSEYTRDYFKSRFPSRQIDLIYNSIEDSNILLEPVSKEVTSPVFISIATDVDDRRKNLYVLIEAFAKLRCSYPDAKLILVGHYRKDQGVCRDAFVNGIQEGVEFRGTMSRDELIHAIDQSTCLVHPALEETFGNTLIEGMARCVPVIGGQNSGAVPFVVDDGICGYLCDITSPDKLCCAMLQTIENPEKTRLMVKSATNKLLSTYSNSVIGKKHIQMYKKAISFVNPHN